jgi:hypothetical protein
MALEWRKGRPYYYKKRRINGRVVSQYVASGQNAQLFARLDQLDQLDAQAAAAAQRAQRSDQAADSAAARGYSRMVRAIVRAALQESGYHQYKGEWRHKRGT